jgi:pimeloyl-ACP methyl ester carboxylesterase
MGGVLEWRWGSTSAGARYRMRAAAGQEAGVWLFVHGLGSSAACWEPVLRYAPAEVGLLSPDLPGFGASPSGSLSPLEAATEMVTELLDQHLRETRVTVVAHSVGTIVALRALQNVSHGNLERLVLVAGTLLNASRAAASARAALADPRLTVMVGIHAMAGIVPLSASRADLLARHAVLRSAFLWPFLAAPREVGHPDLMAVLPHSGGFQSAKAIWSARNVRLAELMAQTTVPTRMVHGLEDRLIGSAEVRTARDLLHPDRVIELERCGHWPHIERPEETATAAFAS